MATITFKDISHSYVPRPDESDYVLRHVDLEFEDGGAYALLGPSGCGKTTMLNIISGLIQPTSGRLSYGERDVTGLPTRERNIGQVFQFPVIYDTMTVFDNLAFPLRNRGVRGGALNKRVNEIARMLDLGSSLRQRAANLTPDMKQIISLGRGLVRDDVAAILLDEPLTVIDAQRKSIIRRKLRLVHEEFRHTSIYVTHDQTEALTFADQVLVMHEGTILQKGSPQELFERPAHTFVGYFIGTPGMNILPCELNDGAAVVAGHRVALPEALWAEVTAEADAKDREFELGVRPEHIALAPPSSSSSGSDNARDSDGPDTVPAVVSTVEDHGYFRIVVAELGDHPVRIKVSDDDGVAMAAGQGLQLRFAPGRFHLYRDHWRVAGPDDPPGGQS